MDNKKQKLISEVRLFLNELEKGKPVKESLEWYLINNLKKYLEALNVAVNVKQVKDATERLDMFCIESMNWDTQLFKRCTEITKAGLKIGKDI